MHVINPCHACAARVTVLGLSVCLSVCVLALILRLSHYCCLPLYLLMCVPECGIVGPLLNRHSLATCSVFGDLDQPVDCSYLLLRGGEIGERVSTHHQDSLFCHRL